MSVVIWRYRGGRPTRDWLQARRFLSVSEGHTRSTLDQTSVASTIAGLPGWPYGPVHAERVVRIGTEHGLSGAAYRVIARTAAGERVAFVVKEERAAGVERALAFHTAMGERLVGSIPTCYGSAVDTARGTGSLYLEDIAPARQGDVLIDPGENAAKAAIRTIARVHAVSWRSRVADHDPIPPRWQAEAWEHERWRDRLTRARSRFPEILSEAVVGRLRDLPARVAVAARTLAAGPASWIHGDAHLDNILWRESGDAVLLDWAGAVIGPPAVDAARFLIEGPPGVASNQVGTAALIQAYQAQLQEGGVPASDVALVPRAIELAAHPLGQSIVGWAGRPEDRPLEPRTARLRENALRGVVAWLDREPGGLFTERWAGP
jgi:thiamine kinase-like enzyme